MKTMSIPKEKEHLKKAGKKEEEINAALASRKAKLSGSNLEIEA